MSSLETGPAHTRAVYREVPFIAFGIFLNLVPAAIVSALKLPNYLDAIGTILITLSLGVRAGILTGVLSFLIGGVTQNPVMPFFAGAQAAIAIYVHLTGRRGWFRGIRVLVPTGIGLGIVAAIEVDRFDRRSSPGCWSHITFRTQTSRGSRPPY